MRQLSKPASTQVLLANKMSRPSLAFEQLAGFVAIRQTQRHDEVLRQLLLQVVVSAGQTTFESASGFATELEVLYGLKMTTNAIQPVLDGLLASRDLLRDRSGVFGVTSETRSAILKRAEEARHLEHSVRQKWSKEATDRHPEIKVDAAWNALEAYLSRAFRHHGLLTMSLIDPAVEVPEEHQVGLRGMLQDAMQATCEPAQHGFVADAISDFLLNASTDSERSAFIAALADCTVSYYSLTVPPDVAAELRKQLKPLTIFLDTNVLFGLVGLDDRPLVQVSHELVTLVGVEKLPFRLRYHEATDRELLITFDSAVSRLTGSTWSPGISRAAAKSPRVSTIQRLYHEQNADRPITAESFFKPFAHLDVLIQDKGIKIYRDTAVAVDKQRVYDLIADYKEFLAQAKREKPYEALEHDMALLDCVRRLRSKSRSSLEAEALCVTTDFHLWRFDRVQSRKKGTLPTMILPNQLLQLLRPFVSITADFDKSFADAFAIPEFRALARGGSAATGRLLEIIAAHGNVSERIATSLLTNDLLLDGLADKKESEIRQFVESAIAADNDLLQREREELGKELAEERSSRAAFEVSIRDSVGNQLAQALTEKDAEARLRSEADQRAVEAGRRAEEAEHRAAETQAALAENIRAVEKEKAAKKARNRTIAGVGGGVIGFLLTEGLWRALDFSWLLEHPNSYGIRGCVALGCFAISLAICRKEWRTYCLIGLSAPALLVLLQILGGPRASNGTRTSEPIAASPTATPSSVPKRE